MWPPHLQGFFLVLTFGILAPGATTCMIRKSNQALAEPHPGADIGIQQTWPFGKKQTCAPTHKDS